MTFVFAVPAPVAVACLCVFPPGRWFASFAPRVAFAIAGAFLLFLHFSDHRVTKLRIHDQFGQPVPEAKITYYLDGRSTERTNADGELKIGYYKGLHRLAVVDAVAGGYEADYRLCSHHPYDPIPPELEIPAWKIRYAPRLLWSMTHADVVPDGRPYFVNLLRGMTADLDDPLADLEVRVEGPIEPPPAPAGEFYAKPFPWSIQIRVRQGGLTLAPKGYPYLAPESGYHESFERSYSPEAKDWSSSMSETFYFKLRNGRVFAVAEVVVTDLREKERGLSVQAKVNPAADRHLFWGNGNVLQHSQSETKPWLRTLFGETY